MKQRKGWGSIVVSSARQLYNLTLAPGKLFESQACKILGHGIWCEPPLRAAGNRCEFISLNLSDACQLAKVIIDDGSLTHHIT